MTTFGWNDFIEVLIFWVGIFLILRSLRGTRGLGILKGGVGIILGLYLASKLLESQAGITLSRLNFLIENLVTFFLIAMIIIFQPELRRGLTRLGEKPFSWLTGPGAGQSVSPVVEAAGHMSRRRIGALIVLERSVGISGIIDSGVSLAADVTAPLIESIFWPNAPLHDGAVVVRGSRVVAACCLLPLSDDPELGPEVGTRHRAAVGLTEETDAIVVVVSEQTGRISVAHYGVLRPMRDTRDLESTINRILAGGDLQPLEAEPGAESSETRGMRASGTHRIETREADPAKDERRPPRAPETTRTSTVRIERPPRSRKGVRAAGAAAAEAEPGGDAAGKAD